MLTEGAKHILGWKSPHFVYNCAMNPKLKLLLRDYKLSDDISLRFNNSDWSEYPLFAENDTVDINTGMIKHSDGYMVTCYDKDDSASKVTVYFDKKFNVTKDAANIKSAQP